MKNIKLLSMILIGSCFSITASEKSFYPVRVNKVDQYYVKETARMIEAAKAAGELQDEEYAENQKKLDYINRFLQPDSSDISITRSSRAHIANKNMRPGNPFYDGSPDLESDEDVSLLRGAKSCFKKDSSFGYDRVFARSLCAGLELTLFNLLNMSFRQKARQANEQKAHRRLELQNSDKALKLNNPQEYKRVMDQQAEIKGIIEIDTTKLEGEPLACACEKLSHVLDDYYTGRYNKSFENRDYVDRTAQLMFNDLSNKENMFKSKRFCQCKGYELAEAIRANLKSQKEAAAFKARLTQSDSEASHLNKDYLKRISKSRLAQDYEEA